MEVIYRRIKNMDLMTQIKSSKETNMRSTVGKLRVEEIDPEDAYSEKIERHLRAAEHFILAARCHKEAAQQYLDGDLDRAHYSTFRAFGHAAITNENHMYDAKHHALEYDC